MSEFKITPQMIYDATSGGLDIIVKYYPDAANCAGNKKFFKIRDEGSASARLDLYNGLWWVKDFGDSGKAMAGIDVMMKEDVRKPSFPEALAMLAEDFQVPVEGVKAKSQYIYEKLDFDPEKHNEGEIFIETKEWEMAELQTIFSRRVWDKLKGKNRKEKDGGLEPKTDDLAAENAAALCKEYGLIPLKYYQQSGRDKNSGNLIIHRFGATAGYPIMMWEAGTWQKIYKPNERDKKYRFVIRGKKSDVMFGYSNAVKMHAALEGNSVAARTDAEGNVKPAEKKLPEIIICSGGSDALNVAALGYAVVWFDSEMFKLSSDNYSKLSGIAERIYYLPDIDHTGIREAVKTGMDYLNIHLIFLPADLRRQYDMRGNACKDVRDFFRTHGERDFELCLKQSFPMRFWDESVKVNKQGEVVVKHGRAVIEYRPNNELLYNFLYRNDFGLFEIESGKDGQMLVRKEGNVLRQIKFKDINRFVKDFLSSESVMRLVGYGYIDIRNAFHRSAQFSENSMQNLNFLTLDFTDSGKDFQYMFFENETWKVTAGGIQVLQNDKVQVTAWAGDLIPDKVKILEAPVFEIFKNENEEYDIRINRTDCHFLNFLIQTSRIHWKTELEERLDQHPEDYREKYLQENKFNIAGPLLTPREIQEQKMILISKLLGNGYLLHRHKDQSETYAIWAMDYNMMNGMAGENDSNGGTGKSINYMALTRYLQHKLISGRNKKDLENPFLLEGVTEHTDLLYIDETSKSLDFDYFYSMITGFMTVNPKNMPGYVVPFRVSPKIAFTSNFTPPRNDKSTARRLWFTSFSDYYHKNPNGDYREERIPKNEFGMTLFDDFNAEQWNLTDNMLANCVQHWLKFGKVDAGESNIFKNILLQKMGVNFMPWADEMFHPDNNRLDTYVQRNILYEDVTSRLLKGLSPQGFAEKLRAWCQYKGYVFNPVDLQRDGRIMKHIPNVLEYKNGQVIETGKSGTKECFYIRTTESKEDEMPF